MSSEFDAFEDAEPVTSDDEDPVACEVDSAEGEAYRRKHDSSGADVPDPDPSDDDLDGEDPHFAACRWCQEPFGTRSAERLHACPQRQAQENSSESAPESVAVDDEVVTPCTHELGAHFCFDGAGLEPYHDIRQLFERADGTPTFEGDQDTVDVDGETWRLLEDELDVWESGLAGRDEDPLDVFEEFELQFESDALVPRSVTVIVRPGFPDAQSVSGDPVGMPRDLPESLRLQVQSSYVNDDELLEVLQGLFAALGLDPDHYREEALYLSSCNLYQLGRYTRQDEEQNRQAITSHNGIIDRLERFSTHAGGSGTRTWDDTEREGYIDAVTLSDQDWAAILPGQQFGKRFQSYLPEHVRGEDSEDPLASPKTEIRFNTQYTSDGAVRWDRRDQLFAELDRALVNVLHWGGLPVRPDPDIYVGDEYFAVDGAAPDWELRQDPTPWLQERDERLALDQVVGADLSEAERDVLEVLARNGQGRYDELAEDAGRSESTVYRLFRKLADTVVSDDGVFSFASEYLQDEFQSLLGLIEDGVDYAARTIDQLQAEDGVDDLGPLGRWARAHGATIDLDRVNDRFEVSFDVGQLSRVDLERILRAGVDAAQETGTKAWQRFRDGHFAWTTTDGQRKTNQSPINNRGAVLRP